MTSCDIWDYLSKKNLNFHDSDIPSFLRCNLCNDILKQAMYSPCGCHFCYQCIKDYLGEDEKTCPSNTCTSDSFSLKRENLNVDLSAKKEVDRLKVVCPQINCDYQCELSKMLDHLRLCSEGNDKMCIYKQIGSGCGDITNDNGMETHLNEYNYEHGKTIVNYLSNVNNDFEILRSQCTNLSNEVDSSKLNLIENVNEIKTKQLLLESKMDARETDMCKIISDFLEINKQNSERMDRYICNFEDYQLETAKCITEQQSMINRLNVQVQTLQHCLTLTGGFKWLIPSITKLKFAGEQFSDIFKLPKLDMKFQLSFNYGSYFLYFFKTNTIQVQMYWLCHPSDLLEPVKSCKVALSLIECQVGNVVIEKQMDFQTEFDKALIDHVDSSALKKIPMKSVVIDLKESRMKDLLNLNSINDGVIIKCSEKY